MPVKSNAIEDIMERIASVLAIIAVKGLDKDEAARRLLSAGFNPQQISGLLDVSPSFAGVAKHRGRRKRRKTRG